VDTACRQDFEEIHALAGRSGVGAPRPYLDFGELLADECVEFPLS
jgi:hypothetical protein